jgi:hypothetical protein
MPKAAVNPMRKTILAFLAGAAAVIGIGYLYDVPVLGTPDINLSLDCRMLTSNWDDHLRTTLTEFEEATAHRSAYADWNGWVKASGVEEYNEHAPMRFVHGWPPADVPTTEATDSAHVVEATGDTITLGGKWVATVIRGYIDRSTGEGKITRYWTNKDGGPDYTRVYKQYLFSCKPVKPAIF